MNSAHRAGSLFLVVMLAVSAAQAQQGAGEKPRHWYKSRMWWAGEGVIAGIQIADAHSTMLTQSNCAGCFERNPLLGAHPRNGQIIAFSAAGFAGLSGLHIFAWKYCGGEKSRAWRMACGAVIPGADAAARTPFIVHNYSIVGAAPGMVSVSLARGNPPPWTPAWAASQSAGGLPIKLAYQLRKN